ncbi:peptide chain release factor N(5)-glutamine methyltransferase [Leucobacter chromiiresistens]|uniref:Release factor glutamine methyltransferase n=1 Tax=Leucobacter chromiiresistens TaxID=1079994 RepID=A0A147ERD3_9MICO|nr:peptide chain release factor N(5)-glutamine methyltransferase [Leucobacter chromiiresistens]KTR87148.1 SAM-dependent methyltransferase [Leucobacter chromiiresistens]
MHDEPGREPTQNPRTDALLGEVRQRLDDGGVADPATDAELLLAHVLGVTRGRVQALAVMREPLAPEAVAAVRELAEERARRIPLQHLTGRAPFRSIELAVGPGVFVPRPETEIVAQFAIDALQSVPDPEPLAVDLCTGSGALALALAHEVPSARVWAVELSAEARAWAERNIAEWGDGRVALVAGDATALSAIPELGPLVGRVHVVVSNPPYVPSGMVPRDPEVRDHDPQLALYGGVDGLDVVRSISRSARELLVPGGAVVIEHAESQGRAIREVLTADGWRAAATHPDLTGRDRVTTALR